jgi:tRNA threonylcarbamoyladenosine biosynthesis protein TsaE
MEKFISNSPEETMEIANNLYHMFGDNQLILLKGEIGSGKTVFTKGYAKAMGIEERITSPTFGVKKDYEKLIHYDLYLSEKKIDLEVILEEDLGEKTIIIE